MIQFVRELASVHFWLMGAALTVLALVSVRRLFRSIDRSRLLADTPTSRIRSAAQGYVELQGTARMLSGQPIVAPLSGLPCVWYRYSVEKTARDPDGDGLFEVAESIDSGISGGIFGLDDGTALCIVDPEGAEVWPLREDCWRGRYRRPGGLPRTVPRLRHLSNRGPFRYREARIHAGEAIWASGRFRAVTGTGLAGKGPQVSRLLADWKKDDAALRRRFDRNGDGDIDVDEWEEAQRAAEAEVGASFPEDARPSELYVLDRPPEGHPFLLSCRPFPRVTVDYGRQAFASAACLLLSAVMLIAVLLIRLVG